MHVRLSPVRAIAPKFWNVNTLQDIDTVGHKIVAGSRQRTDLTGLFTSFTANDPQQLVQIDREKAKAIGVPISQVTQALGVYMGSQYVNDFDFNNRSYRVYVQADQPFRMTARDLREYYVRSDTNGLVPCGKPGGPDGTILLLTRNGLS